MKDLTLVSTNHDAVESIFSTVLVMLLVLLVIFTNQGMSQKPVHVHLPTLTSFY